MLGKSKYFVQAIGDGVSIAIRDDIGPDWAGCFSDETLQGILGQYPNAKTIRLEINSQGGDCFTAFAIYNILKRTGAFIEVLIDGLAASAASIIAMAGDHIEIAKNAMLMIHRCWVLIAGNEEDLAKQIPLMKKIDGSMLDTYAERTGQS